jgi:hypothetical protein
MRVKHKMNFRVYDDVEAVNPLFAPDDTKSEVVLDNMQRVVSGRFEIAASGNENLSLGDVGEVRGLLIVADNDFNLAINGSAPALPIRRANTAANAPAQTARFAAEVQIGAGQIVNVANQSATAVLRGYWCAYGAPT